MNKRLGLGVPLLLAISACGPSPTGSDTPAPERPVAWVDNVWTQPVPSWGSPVRLSLPVPLQSIVLGPAGGLGAFGAHQGGHVEGLNHVWIPIVPGTTIRSWAAGKVTKIDDMGDRGAGNGTHEFFITIDYGQGLIGTHLDADKALVKVGDQLREGDPVASGPSAEFMLVDNNRTDGERTGGRIGSPVSPFDYLKDDVKAALVAKHVSEVVTPYFMRGQTAGNGRPWEPALTNPMLFHATHKGALAGEWILTNKGWKTPDPSYFDVLTIFDVANAYGRFQRFEAMDQNWSLPGSKGTASGAWAGDGTTGHAVFTAASGPTWYGLYSVDESSGRAKLTLQWQQGTFPAALSAGAAVYVERNPIYLHGDATELGLLK